MTRAYHPLRQQQNQPEPLAFSAKECAQALGICESTLRTLTKSGEIPHRKAGRRVLYPVPLMRRWLEEQAVCPVVKQIGGEE